ncbi:glutamate 5-kinase [Candidatus Palauibacter sp.]|uniref:glutamate 5-kinase n=1 Tax=Candidatus Palauibacter sp. TaxID=3101350 RepID=UPI003AF314E7
MTQAQQIPTPRPETGVPDVTREVTARAGRIVLKVGTGVLTHPDGTIALARLFSVVEVASRLRREGREVLIVTSGAVGLGRVALQLPDPPDTAELKQTCAAVGQSRLMELYQQGFARLGVTCAQILITWTDFDDRVRYLNLHETLQSLFRLGVVPIVNENDAISLNDRVYRGTGKRPIFDDNDRLGALVASELAADLIVLLTDVPGVMTADPRRDPGATLITRIDRPEDHEIEIDGQSDAGRGGMASKLEAASVASRGGCHTVIASGLAPGVLDRVLAGEEEGTWVPPRQALSSRSRWIAYCSHPRGTLVLGPEAVDRLRGGTALRAGAVAKAEGQFRRGDVVEIRAPDGALVGRGVVAVDSAVAREAVARRPASFGGRELVAREHIILKHRPQGRPDGSNGDSNG